MDIEPLRSLGRVNETPRRNLRREAAVLPRRNVRGLTRKWSRKRREYPESVLDDQEQTSHSSRSTPRQA